MRIALRFSTGAALSFFSACVHPRWRQLAPDVAILQQVRAARSETVSCEPEPTQLGDYAFSVKCGPSIVFVRCGYHHGTACCWPVETANEATAVFGQSEHVREGVVCGPLRS